MPIHSVTHVYFDGEINLFIKFTKFISSRLFPRTNSFTRLLFIDQYLECVSMWDSRLRVVIGELHIFSILLQKDKKMLYK